MRACWRGPTNWACATRRNTNLITLTGTNRKMYLHIRKKWPAQEINLNLRQYLWLPFTEEDLHKCEVTKDEKKLSL